MSCPHQPDIMFISISSERRPRLLLHFIAFISYYIKEADLFEEGVFDESGDRKLQDARVHIPGNKGSGVVLWTLR